MKKHVTIYDIAAEAGVSPMTVSRALRPGPKKAIRPETVLRIEGIARKLNYHAHTGARALVLRKTFNIGFCTSFPGFNYYERAQNIILRKMQARLHEAGYRMGFYYFEQEHPEEFEVFLNHHRTVDAIVVVANTVTDRELSIIEQSGVRCVAFHGELPGMHCVTNSFYDMGYQAAELIRSRGFRQVTVFEFTAAVKEMLSSLPRPVPKGALHGLKARGKEIGLQVVSMNHHWDPMYDPAYAIKRGLPAPDLVKRLIASGEAGRCVFVGQDQYPLRIMQQMTQLGLQAGKDISFVGLGNIEPLGWGPWKKPRLTSFDPQREKLGHLLADLVMEVNDDPPKTHVVPAIPVLRSSLGVGPDLP